MIKTFAYTDTAALFSGNRELPAVRHDPLSKPIQHALLGLKPNCTSAAVTEVRTQAATPYQQP